MPFMTTANTQAEIVAEAVAITRETRAAVDHEIRMKIRELRETTGVNYSWCVKQARFQLEIVDRSGKKVVCIPVSEFMPYFEFAAYMKSFEA